MVELAVAVYFDPCDVSNDDGGGELPTATDNNRTLSPMQLRYRYIILSSVAIVVFVLSAEWTPRHIQSHVEAKESQPKQQFVVRTSSFPVSNTTIGNTTPTAIISDPGAECPFRRSPLYQKIFVYPSPDDTKGWAGDILSDAALQNLTPPWPWLEYMRHSATYETTHYDIDGNHVQYTTELLIRELLMHPKSCLRTYNPEEATLFYVPYLASVDFYQAFNKPNKTTSPYAQALLDILDYQNYTAWEHLYGSTSKYWKRRQGADHILVFSQPLRGLWHRQNGNGHGHFHLIHTQKQLTSPIVVTVEHTTTFVQDYPACARKNINMPYPNSDGRWFNGHHDRFVHERLSDQVLARESSWHAALPAEVALRRSTTANVSTASQSSQARPAAYFYNGGNHGMCTDLRKTLSKDFQCHKASKFLQQHLRSSKRIPLSYTAAMRAATFCPTPGGDSPGAKRMYDAILAGCIPVVLSHDFVWPLTRETDAALTFDPNEFSVRLNSTEFVQRSLDASCVHITNTTSVFDVLDAVDAAEIARLRAGLVRARQRYAWYEDDPNLPDNPLKEHVLPTGGAAHALLEELAKRAGGVRWPACQAELTSVPSNRKEPKNYVC